MRLSLIEPLAQILSRLRRQATEGDQGAIQSMHVTCEGERLPCAFPFGSLRARAPVPPGEFGPDVRRLEFRLAG